MHGRRHARSWLPSVRAFGCGCPDRSDLFINPYIKGLSYLCSREHTQHASASQKKTKLRFTSQSLPVACGPLRAKSSECSEPDACAASSHKQQSFFSMSNPSLMRYRHLSGIAWVQACPEHGPEVGCP